MKRFILSLFALLLIGGIAKAEESYTISDIDLPQNGVGELQVAYSLEAKDCSGFSFEIHLPDGLELVKDNGKYLVAQGFDSESSVTVEDKVGEDFVLVTWFSSNATPINRKSGYLIALKVKATKTFSIGTELTCYMKNPERSIGSTAEMLANQEFKVKITEPINYVVLDENSAFLPDDTEGNVDILVKRTITGGEWSTICLPFDLNSASLKSIFGDDVKLAELVSYGSDDEFETMYINFEETYALDKNKPYIILTSGDITSFNVNATIYTEDVKTQLSKTDKFIGTYQACTKVPENALFISNNTFYYSIGTTMMKGYRAYFQFKNTIKDLSKASTRAIINIGDGTTGIRNAKLEGEETGKVYSMTGQYMGERESLKSLPKGVYIIDGKKVINK